MLAQQIAKHLRDVYFGGNWTSVNLKDTLADISWQQSITKVYNLNTIAALVFHINYYVSVVLKVLQGEPLNASDKFSFDLSPITSKEDWQNLTNKTLAEAELLAAEIEKLEEVQLFEVFTESKYGNYYRNLHGITEHTHYHLGQIFLIKKILTEMEATN
ncbi:DUF1572 domain-containing protein [Adhaeribacter radiodurans]|uniref:DUF1572 domain-containing protein n=1 Tax=Adhaeribacter radiodurans TaxID=2745197 RepID=A0A7L7LEU9_9BACT|nr:DUF1572 domain-containing protein [Adhaeribacter radiodurans]QMU31351.1 DUF1572 domain-containing protein [Adhaeribacter radiodurans]